MYKRKLNNENIIENFNETEEDCKYVVIDRL